jgi:hypothetical protein
MRSLFLAGAALAAMAVLGGCSEKPQDLGARKTGAPSWEGTGSAYAEPGWKPGDQKSWETQMRNRALRGQDEYGRTGGPAS